MSGIIFARSCETHKYVGNNFERAQGKKVLNQKALEESLETIKKYPEQFEAIYSELKEQPL